MASSKVGFDFFVDCFMQYWGGEWIIPILFVLSVIYILIKKEKLWNRTFLFPFVFGACTVFNPFIINAFLKKLGWYNRYYRFYWIIPFSLVISLVVVDVLERVKKKRYKVFLVIIVLGLVIIYRSPVVFNAKNWNIYKVSNDTMEVSEIIHQDTNEQTPYVLADNTIVDTLRQYDPSIISVLRLYEILSLNHELEEVYDAYMNSENELILMANYDVEIDAELVNARLHTEKIDYFVRNKEWYSDEYLKTLDIAKIGETTLYEVYKVVRE